MYYYYVLKQGFTPEEKAEEPKPYTITTNPKFGSLEVTFTEKPDAKTREALKALQSERLVKQVKHMWDNVPYYRTKMEDKGVTPEDIRERIAYFRASGCTLFSRDQKYDA